MILDTINYSIQFCIIALSLADTLSIIYLDSFQFNLIYGFLALIFISSFILLCYGFWRLKKTAQEIDNSQANKGVIAIHISIYVIVILANLSYLMTSGSPKDDEITSILSILSFLISSMMLCYIVHILSENMYKKQRIGRY